MSLLLNVLADPGENPTSSSMCKRLLLRRLSGRNVKLSGEVKNDLGHSSTLLTSFEGVDRDRFTVF